MPGPEISVVVPSHNRRLRLRWLLNALEEQTLARERWEVVIATTNEELAAIVRDHPLGARHVLPHASSPAAQRNAGWRAARAPLILFTDDDCRPDPRWVERMLGAAGRHQGVLDRCEGFDERFPGPAGEDLDLAERAKALGVGYEGEADALVYHAVEAYALPQAIRLARKWEAIPYLVKRHPHLRRAHSYPLGIFWRPTHFRLVLALGGAAFVLAGRRPAALLVLPYVWFKITRRGTRKRALAVGVLELPGQAVVDAAEVAVLARGSVEHRTLVL